MTYKTAKVTSFEEYLAYEKDCQNEAGYIEGIISARESRLLIYPYSAMMLVAFPEMDFADRWIWNMIGPSSGDCRQSASEYCACSIEQWHTHSGTWCSHFFGKTEYDYGFNEWYFQSESDLSRFIKFIPDINWGECYPK